MNNAEHRPEMCAKCGKDGRLLPGPSADAWVNYFYCDACGHSWLMDKALPDPDLPPAPKFVGGVTYEGRYFIVRVRADWRQGQPLPPPSPDDRWFDRLADFEAAMDGPWDRKPLNRHPHDANVPERPVRPDRTKPPR
jgi:hypothetical protein